MVNKDEYNIFEGSAKGTRTCSDRAWSECWPDVVVTEMTYYYYYCTASTTTTTSTVVTASRQHRLYVIVGSTARNCVSNSLPNAAECCPHPAPPPPPPAAAAAARGDPLTTTVISCTAYNCASRLLSIRWTHSTRDCSVSMTLRFCQQKIALLSHFNGSE